MDILTSKNIVVGVSGGIAAYKVVELVRRLQEAGANVRVLMTAAATEFVTALTFQSISGHHVYTDLFARDDPAAMDHITLARWADAIVIAPASANTLARLAYGLADDLLGTLVLAASVPVMVAPAMNRQMWHHPSTQENCVRLRQRGVLFSGPAEGSQACGDVGVGRMVEPPQIMADLRTLWAHGSLAQRKIVITAGPTQEPLDPVRYLTNRSSGKMGYALASAAASQGAVVTLISGPVALAPPSGLRLVRVQTAEDMAAAIAEHIPGTDIFIAAAAVADYRAVHIAAGKIKKSTDRLTLELEPTPDIVAAVAAKKQARFVVGFAAETDNIQENAKKKLASKALDLICANDVCRTDVGFSTDDNELLVLWPGGQRRIAKAHKQIVAKELIQLIVERYEAKSTVKDS